MMQNLIRNRELKEKKSIPQSNLGNTKIIVARRSYYCSNIGAILLRNSLSEIAYEFYPFC